jgi:hypothetical protein
MALVSRDASAPARERHGAGESLRAVRVDSAAGGNASVEVYGVAALLVGAFAGFTDGAVIVGDAFIERAQVSQATLVARPGVFAVGDHVAGNITGVAVVDRRRLTGGGLRTPSRRSGGTARGCVGVASARQMGDGWNGRVAGRCVGRAAVVPRSFAGRRASATDEGDAEKSDRNENDGFTRRA